MRCTECTGTVKPVVALDIDGTLSEYHLSLMRFAANYFGRVMPHHYDGSTDLATAMGLTKPEYRTMKLAYRQGGMKRVQPVFDGAVQLCDELREAGAEIWLTTTRPYNRHDSTDPDTLEWIRRNGIQYDYLLYDDDKYSVLLGLVDPVRIVGILEDQPDQYDRAYGLGLPVVMIQREHNEACRRRVTVPNLVRASRLFRGSIEAWKVIHA